MSVLANANAMGAGGVDTGGIGHSLRLRSAASAYLNRTFGSPTNAYGWAFSTWVKVGNLATRQILLSGYNGVNDRGYLEINDSGILRYDDFYSGSQKCLKVSNAVFRDPTSWYHVFVLCNTDHATAEDRLQIYVNGVRITAWSSSTNYGLSVQPQINWSAHSHYINNIGGGQIGDGYRARTCFVDSGTALTPSSFGYLNTEINEWVSKSQSAVKAVVDAGGTNSFMLDFDDGTSLTTLGYDKSSKGNNWTLTNVSITPGPTYDWMLDVPGNSFATLNPLSKGSSVTMSEGNLSYSQATASHISQPTSQSVSSGKWYAEVVITATGGTYPSVGIATSAYQVAAEFIGQSATSWGYAGDGTKRNSGSTPAYGSTYTTGDVIGIIFDADNGKLYFSKNGVVQNSGDPVAGTGFAYSGLSGSFQFAISGLGSPSPVTLNFCSGQAPLHASATYHSAAGGYFRYAPPTGYKALCQRNMPDPAILNPEKHFDVVTRTGTAATYSVAGLGFQPDLVWVKSRGRAVDHALYDSVRGVQKQLESNQTGAETTETTGITAFNSNGYTGGALDQINGTTATNSFVDWLWKAGGAAVTNNAGSISSQVSANVLAGQSVVKHINTGAPATIGHGLLQAPQLIINKVYDRAENWRVYFGQANKLLILNNISAEATDTNIWNNTQPTSSVFSIGTYFSNGDDIISYCFHSVPGYSKVFSYTGNGSADGPYVECGFKPKFVMVKRVDSTGDWCVVDAVRDPDNAVDSFLYPNQTLAEQLSPQLDFTATGFKFRGTAANTNASGGTYIFYAVADVPAKYSLAR